MVGTPPDALASGRFAHPTQLIAGTAGRGAMATFCDHVCACVAALWVENFGHGAGQHENDGTLSCACTRGGHGQRGGTELSISADNPHHPGRSWWSRRYGRTCLD